MKRSEYLDQVAVATTVDHINSIAEAQATDTEISVIDSAHITSALWLKRNEIDGDTALVPVSIQFTLDTENITDQKEFTAAIVKVLDGPQIEDLMDMMNFISVVKSIANQKGLSGTDGIMEAINEEKEEI